MRNEFHYAVVVGINRYPGIRDLRKPRDDALGFCKWLLADDGGRLPPDHIRKIVASKTQEARFERARDSRPKGDELEQDLLDLHGMLEKQLERQPAGWYESRLYIYVSGHGIAPAGGVGAFQFADAEPERGYWDHAEFLVLKEWYETKALFREVVIFADCCRDRRALAPGYLPKFSDPRQNYGEAMDWILAYATEHGGKAFEPPEEDVDATYGFFTDALLEGLKGGAADPLTGEIRADHLARYVRGWVDAKTFGTKYHQTSKVSASDLAEPIILRPQGLGVLRRKRWWTTIKFPQGFAGRAELLRGGHPIGREWDAADGPWRVRLEEGEYQVRPLSGAKPGEVWKLPVYAKERDVEL